MARATTRDVSRDQSSGDVSALEQEVDALRKEVRLLQLANEELERLVVRDTLTPLYNRRHFIACLAERLNRLERYGAQSALVFVDVNGMKLINDTFGHSAGDYALLHVARMLGACVRNTDIAARVGGDEFALLLDGVSEGGAADKARQLASMIAETECRFGNHLLPLSASFGCTDLRPGDSDFAAIARADMAMYSAKRQASGGSWSPPARPPAGEKGMSDVRDNAERSRYELAVDGGLALADYHRQGDVLAITHTEVPPALQGQGIAARLIDGVVADARARGLKIRPLCSYVVTYFRRHPEAGDVLAA